MECLMPGSRVRHSGFSSWGMDQLWTFFQAGSPLPISMGEVFLPAFGKTGSGRKAFPRIRRSDNFCLPPHPGGAPAYLHPRRHLADAFRPVFTFHRHRRRALGDYSGFHRLLVRYNHPTSDLDPTRPSGEIHAGQGYGLDLDGMRCIDRRLFMGSQTGRRREIVKSLMVESSNRDKRLPDMKMPR